AQVEGLEEVVVGALLHRLDGRVRRLGQGDEDDRNPRVDAADLLVDLEPRLVRQTQVEENNIGRGGPYVLKPFRPGPGHDDAVARPVEGLAYLLRDKVRVIVDEQQLRHD